MQRLAPFLLVGVLALCCRSAQADQPQRNPRWITASIRQDLAWLDGNEVCSPASQSAGDFSCFRGNETQYLGTPNPADASRVRGLTFATTRILVGYQHFVTHALAVSGVVGAAIRGGGPKPLGESAHAFLPLHLEAQLSVWPWGAPLGTGRVRPFASFGGGIGQIDAHANVRVREDRSAPAAPSQLDNPDEQTLSVYRKSGIGFAAAGLGAACSLSRHWVLRIAMQGLVSFPAPGLGASLDAGIAFDL